MPLTDRIIDISENGAALSARNGLLVIARQGGETTVPFDETAVVVIAHRAVNITHGALSALCSSGGICIVCDDKHLPAGMLMPLAGHTTQAERFAAQAAAPLPKKKQIWKTIIKTKVMAQGHLLKQLRGSDWGLSELAKHVRSGDDGNIEAQSSQRYWPALFGSDFRRSDQGSGINHMLNYGYAILRAITARAICSSGLHPSLGVHHHNRYDSFCLADDLMEPFRPVVDGAVAAITEITGKDTDLDRDTKKDLIGELNERRFNANGEQRTLFDVMTKVTSSLADVFEGRRETIFLPEV